MNVTNLLKDMAQTMFRLLPFPTATGLRAVGQPGPDAPVLITCNFDLTVRRVTRALQGLDCYLLVAQSKGINVWCAAGGGHLNAYSVTSAIRTSRIGEKVTHRTLILPQLSAPGIDVARVEQETGWTCQFGPVYAEDIAAYLEAGMRATERMRLVRFGLAERLQMAVMWAAPLSLVAGIGVGLASLQLLPGALALIWFFALFVYVFYEPIMSYLPGPTGVVKTTLLGMGGMCLVGAYGLGFAGWRITYAMGWCLGIAAVAIVLGIDLDGTSPLRAGSTVAYWGRRWPQTLEILSRVGFHLDPAFVLSVNWAACRGCGTCVEVCPVGVLEMHSQGRQLTARIAFPERCVQCTACVKQCPAGAILADPALRPFEG